VPKKLCYYILFFAQKFIKAEDWCYSAYSCGRPNFSTAVKELRMLCGYIFRISKFSHSGNCEDYYILGCATI
jgi:hypothetical protein